MHVQQSSRTTWLLAFLAPASGLVAGVLAKIADESGMGRIGDFGTYPGAWIFVLVLIGWYAQTPARAAVSAALFFVAMCLSYYAWSYVVLGNGFDRDVATAWALLAVTLCPTIAGITRSIRVLSAAAASGWLGLAAAGILGTGTVWNSWLRLTGQLGSGAPDHSAQAILELCVSGFLVVALPPSWRLRAIAFAVAVAAWPLVEHITNPVANSLGLT